MPLPQCMRKLIVAASLLLLTGCIAETASVTVRSAQGEPGEPEDNTPVVQTSPDTTVTPPPADTGDTSLPPTLADITDLILITGQSNALGAGTGYDYRIDTPDNRVFAYTSDGWQMADLHQIWDQDWFPRTTPGTEPSNNFSLHFGKRVVELAPNRVLGFLLITAPGQPIAYWDANGAFFDEIRSKVSNAINELPSASGIDGILWHQGESDGRDDDAYGQSLYNLIANFRSESWFGYDKPFICGETAALAVNVQLNKLNSDNDPWTACVAAEGLPTRGGDNAHFNAESLRTIGRRYGDRFVDMTR